MRKLKECSSTQLTDLIAEAVHAGLYRSTEEATEALLADVQPEMEKLDDFDRTIACQSLQQQLSDVQFRALLDMEGFVYLPKLSSKVTKLDLVMLVNGPKRRGALIGPRGRTANFAIQNQNAGMEKRWLYFPSPRTKSLPDTEIKYLASSLRTSVTRLKDAAEFAARSCFEIKDTPWVRFGEANIETLDRRIADKVRLTAFVHLINVQNNG